MVNINQLVTEQRNNKTQDLDIMSVHEALKVMNEEDYKVLNSIKGSLDDIEKAIHLVIKQLKDNGRLIYMGAGTSGRLGVLDASECPPTFGTDKERVIGLIAGGQDAFTEAIEGSEDSENAGKSDLQGISISSNDVCIGLAASGRTPYVVGGLKYARSLGVPTISIACNPDAIISQLSDISIEAVVGPEVLTGSTRLKAGTAQKLILNMISTLSMVGIGKVYQNLMVDVQLSNEKLHSRAEKIVQDATDADIDKVRTALKESSGSTKIAIVMLLLGINNKEAKQKLNSNSGFVRQTLMEGTDNNG